MASAFKKFTKNWYDPAVLPIIGVIGGALVRAIIPHGAFFFLLVCKNYRSVLATTSPALPLTPTTSTATRTPTPGYGFGIASASSLPTDFFQLTNCRTKSSPPILLASSSSPTRRSTRSSRRPAPHSKASSSAGGTLPSIQISLRDHVFFSCTIKSSSSSLQTRVPVRNVQRIRRHLFFIKIF